LIFIPGSRDLPMGRVAIPTSRRDVERRIRVADTADDGRAGPRCGE
jgi:hypothetical protein